tara:strand:- start:14276 stop:14419 length:144 start_codon:yes stop_codon:yes gene_type:complete
VKVKYHSDDRHIKCKCGKYWGMAYFLSKKECGRCRSIVKARGIKDGK